MCKQSYENDKPKRMLAVASAGGHWTQLSLISDAFSHCDVSLVTTGLNKSISAQQKDITIVSDADMSSKLRLVVLSLQILWIVVWKRPQIVLSTGAAPGFFAVFFGKLIGAKTIWLDSMANPDKLSMSGEWARRFSDLFLTQWPDLADDQSVLFRGSLL